MKKFLTHFLVLSVFSFLLIIPSFTLVAQTPGDDYIDPLNPGNPQTPGDGYIDPLNPGNPQTPSPDPGNPQTPGQPTGCVAGKLCNPLAFPNIESFISALLSIVVQLGVPIAIFFFIFAGFKYVTARGNAEKIGEAHKAFLWTAVGAFVLLGASLLSQVLEGTINQITGR